MDYPLQQSRVHSPYCDMVVSFIVTYDKVYLSTFILANIDDNTLFLVSYKQYIF